VLATVQQLRDVLADSAHQLTDAEAAVMLHALDVAAERGTTRPALPRHVLVAACKAAGVGERATRTALQRLLGGGALHLAVRGRPGVRSASGTSGRANLYRLPTCAAARIPVPGDPACGTPPRRSRTDLWDPRPTAPRDPPHRPMGPLPATPPRRQPWSP